MNCATKYSGGARYPYLMATVFLAMFLLSGCSLPVSREEMLAQQSSPVKVCSNLLREDAVQRIGQAWKRCFWSPSRMNLAFTSSGVIPYPSAEIVISQESRGEVVSLSANLQESMMGNPLLLLADIEVTASCRSSVTVWAANSHWRKRAAYSAAWLENPMASSPELECKQ